MMKDHLTQMHTANTIGLWNVEAHRKSPSSFSSTTGRKLDKGDKLRKKTQGGKSLFCLNNPA